MHKRRHSLHAHNTEMNEINETRFGDEYHEYMMINIKESPRNIRAEKVEEGKNYSLQSISLNIFMFAFLSMLLLLSYLILLLPSLPIHFLLTNTHSPLSERFRRMFSTYNSFSSRFASFEGGE